MASENKLLHKSINVTVVIIVIFFNGWLSKQSTKISSWPSKDEFVTSGSNGHRQGLSSVSERQVGRYYKDYSDLGWSFNITSHNSWYNNWELLESSQGFEGVLMKDHSLDKRMSSLLA